MKRIVILSFVLVSLLTSIWMVYTIINRNSTDNTVRLNIEALASSEAYYLADCLYESSMGSTYEVNFFCLDDGSGYELRECKYRYRIRSTRSGKCVCEEQ